MNGTKILTASELSNSLGISTATFMNWKKAGLIPEQPKKITNESYNNYIKRIKENTSSKLAARANRSLSNEKFIVFLGVKNEERKKTLVQCITEFENSGLSTKAGVFSLILCQLKSEKIISDDWYIKPVSRIEKNCKVWLEEALKEKNDIKEIFSLYSNYCINNANDDFIGAFYQSIQSIAEKSTKGSFYTPPELLEKIQFEPNKTVYDPCCGSGNLLLNVLSAEHDTSLISASDIDTIALWICETNLVLFFNNPNIKSNIFLKDFINSSVVNEKKTFECIITNPPWGAKFSAEYKKQLEKKFSFLNNTESFSISLYNALNFLSADGNLYFFLPKSFLNVNCHKEIRKTVLKEPATLSITMLGHAFKGVVSEAILLNIRKDSESETIQIEDKTKKHSILKSTCTSPDYLFSTQIDKTNAEIIKKVYQFPHVTLKDNAIFALGIVTGNNKKFISTIKNDENEPIFRGKHINPFLLEKSDEYIIFNPESFQQVASTDYYRTRKIVYRFISDSLICCISEKNELMLNSANMFIPKFDYPLETIVCLFNSSLYSFLYRKKFDSFKILRNQIEQLPLPLFSEQQHKKLFDLYQEIIQTHDFKTGIERIDTEICQYLGIIDYIDNIHNK